MNENKLLIGFIFFFDFVLIIYEKLVKMCILYIIIVYWYSL